MKLTAGIEIVCEAMWEVSRVRVTRGAADVAVTEPTSDPAVSACLQLAATLTQKLSLDERAAAGIFLATRFGCLLADMEFDRSRREAEGRFASPAAFRGTLPSTAAAEISVQLGIRGPAVTLLGISDLHDLAIRRACAWMKHVRLRHALVGTFDASRDNQASATMQLLERNVAGHE